MGRQSLPMPPLATFRTFFLTSAGRASRTPRIGSFYLKGMLATPVACSRPSPQVRALNSLYNHTSSPISPSRICKQISSKNFLVTEKRLSLGRNAFFSPNSIWTSTVRPNEIRRRLTLTNERGGLATARPPRSVIIRHEWGHRQEARQHADVHAAPNPTARIFRSEAPPYE